MAIEIAATSDIRPVVDELIDDTGSQRASDVHIDPTANGYQLRYRIDGLLINAASCDGTAGPSIVSRLMVLAQLLTCRLDIPQEGCLHVVSPSLGRPIEMRLAIMPTTHGRRAALRLPAELTQPRSLDESITGTRVGSSSPFRSGRRGNAAGHRTGQRRKDDAYLHADSNHR